MDDLFTTAANEAEEAAGEGETRYRSVMEGLSDAQRDAVTHEGGPLIVLAGPGTGKTRVITARVAHMIHERGIKPDQIVAVTYTNKAAEELRGRLAELVGDTLAARLRASTFHSMGLAIIRRFADLLALPSNPEIIDSAQRNRLIREIIRDKRLYRDVLGSGIDAATEHAQKTMESLRHLGMDSAAGRAWLDGARDRVEALEGDARDARSAELDRFADGLAVYGYFEQCCRERGWLVFDDLILLPSQLMRTHESARAILRQEHRHVLVDEFQDVNSGQIDLIRSLCPPERNPDLCVVGDDDQSIYGFRGADDRAFAHFDAIWHGSRTVELTTNYRSARVIVDASNTIITRAASRFAPGKQAIAHRGDVPHASVELVELDDDGQTGEAIASMLLKMAGEGGQGFSFCSCAVIARTRGFLEQIAQTLMLEGIPIDMRQNHSPMEDDGVMDVFAWARWLVDPESSVDLRRILTRPPYRCDPVKLGSLLSGYRAARSRFESAGSGTEEQNPGALLDWILLRCDESTKPKIERMRTLAQELGRIAGERNAGETVFEIIKRTGVVHRELGDGRWRAKRIQALSAVVRFAQSRAARFDAPGDLGAMLRYYDDLDKKEQTLEELPEQKVDNSGNESVRFAGSGEFVDRGAVSLLTAHSSKGLEFDTVFIARVGNNGFPSKIGVDDGVLPVDVIDRSDDARDENARHSDEERRVFFVALTRAERRAVLLAKIPKTTKVVNFAIELRDAFSESLVRREVSEVVDPDRAGDAVSRLSAEFKAERSIRDLFDQAKRDARRDAAQAIDAHELGEIEREVMGARVSAAADRAALVNEILRDGAMPAWIKDDSTRAFGQRLLEAIQNQGKVEFSGKLHPGLVGPLKLSFSQIAKYLHCPRCYLAEVVHQLHPEENLRAKVGTAIHKGLEIFYRRWRDADAEGQPTPGFDVLEATVKKQFMQEWPRGRAIEQDDIDQLDAMLHMFWTHLHRDDAHIEELEKSHTIVYECAGMKHRIEAKIDRVDASESGGRRVIDYKTGAPRKKLVQPDKDDLQLGIYAMALREELGDPGPGSVCEYWLLQDGSRGVIGFDALNMKKIHSQIDKAITGMLEGNWSRGRSCNRDDAPCMILDTRDADFSDSADG